MPVTPILGECGGDTGGLTDAQLRATPVPVTTTSSTRSTLNTALTGGAGRNIPVGRRSYTLVVTALSAAGSTTIDGVAIPAIGTYTWSADGGNTLAAAVVATGAGDSVLVMEIF